MLNLPWVRGTSRKRRRLVRTFARSIEQFEDRVMLSSAAFAATNDWGSGFARRLPRLLIMPGVPSPSPIDSGDDARLLHAPWSPRSATEGYQRGGYAGIGFPRSRYTIRPPGAAR
jgi:hypothetical protein